MTIRDVLYLLDEEGIIITEDEEYIDKVLEQQYLSLDSEIVQDGI